MTVDIRRVTSLEDCETARAIAAAVWGSDAACSIPQMSVHANYGGVVLLAYADHKPVGFLFSFPAMYRGEWVLWSHETAVLPEYLHKGIGSALKFYQRTVAGELGYKTIAWTYDPLVSRNAHFNLNKLGATVVEYKVNAYGADENDLVNQGIETDRFIAVWEVNPVVNARSTNAHERIAIAVGEDAEPLVHIHRALGGPEDQSRPRLQSEVHPEFTDAGGDEVFVTQIPLELAANWQTRAVWREAFRDAATRLFESGLTPVQFRKTSGYGEYIWAK